MKNRFRGSNLTQNVRRSPLRILKRRSVSSLLSDDLTRRLMAAAFRTIFVGLLHSRRRNRFLIEVIPALMKFMALF